MISSQSRVKAFTLVEVVIAAVIAFIMGLSIILTITQSYYHKQWERERAVALNRASIKVEELKRVLFPAVRATTENILLDVQNTPSDSSDDIPAQLIVELFHIGGQPITHTGADSSMNREASDEVELRVSVRWEWRSKVRRQSINTRLTP